MLKRTSLFGPGDWYPRFGFLLTIGISIIFAISPLVFILSRIFTDAALDPAQTLRDPRFISASLNSIQLSFILALLLTVLTFVFTILTTEFQLVGSKILFALSLIPLVVPDQVFGVLGRALFDPSIGLLRAIVPDHLLIERNHAIAVVVLVSFLKWFPCIVILANLSLLQLGRSTLIQMRLDFTSLWSRIAGFYLPALRNIMIAIACFGFLIGFRQFEIPIELTSGGAGFNAEPWSVWNHRVLFEFADLPTAALEALLVLLALSFLILFSSKAMTRSLTFSKR